MVNIQIPDMAASRSSYDMQQSVNTLKQNLAKEKKENDNLKKRNAELMSVKCSLYTQNEINRHHFEEFATTQALIVG